MRSPFASPAAEGIINLLMIADQLASGWLVNGPLVVEGSVTSFEGVFNVGAASRPHVAGLEWASFSVFESSAVRPGA